MKLLKHSGMHKFLFTFLLFSVLNLWNLQAQNFQRQYGASYDDAFTKVVQSGSSYYAIGYSQPTAGSIRHATVSRINASGQLQWTLSLNTGSVWNDAVLASNGSILLVGNSLPNDATGKSIMAQVSSMGAFSWVRSYDVTGSESFQHIVKNQSPENGAFPYYVSGYQHDASGGANWDDVVLLNMSETGSINWKKTYLSTDDDEFSKSLKALPNGDLLLAGNQGSQGVVYRADNTGALFNAAGPEGLAFSFHDVALAEDGGFYAIGDATTGGAPYLVKFNEDQFPVWQRYLNGLISIDQVWGAQGGNGIYITGTAETNGNLRTVITHYSITNNDPTLEWTKYLDNGEIAYTAGATSYALSDLIAYVDGRQPATNGFGLVCAYMSVTDLSLESCMTAESGLNEVFADLSYYSPVPPDFETFPIPSGTNLSGTPLIWQQQDACSSTPCDAEFSFQNPDCSNAIQFTNNSTGPSPLTYSWTFSDPASGANNASSQQDPSHTFIGGCNSYNVCLTVNGNGCSASICKTVVLKYNQPVTLNCPPNIQVDCDNKTAPALTGTASLTEPCDAVLQPITFVDAINGNLPCNGTILRTWSGTDECNIVHTCLQTITVLDNVPPTITCPPNTTVSTNPGLCIFSGALPMATANDNCNPNPNVNCYTRDATGNFIPVDSNTVFTKGEHSICCTADDGCVDLGDICEHDCAPVGTLVQPDQALKQNTSDSALPLLIQQNYTADDLVKNIFVGGPCFDIANVTTQGNPIQFGAFFNGQSSIGLSNGVLLSTGDCSQATGPNNSDSKSTGNFGATPDANLATIATGALYDRAGLEFDFTPTQNNVTFRFVFASEEYCERVGTANNDQIGFFISGPGITGTQNLAVIPSTTTPISINTINHLSNSGFYANNQPSSSGNLCGQPASSTAATTELQYDGFTAVFTAFANVQPCQTYHIKLAIADVNDDGYDSAVFFQAGTFDAGGNASVDLEINGQLGSNTAYEDCDNVQLVFNRVGGNAAVPLVVPFTIGGTAISGLDYASIPSSITIPANQTQVTLSVVLFNDLVIENDETMVITLTNGCSCSAPNTTLTIKDHALLLAKCNYTITVVDNEPPTLSCPPDLTVQGIYDPTGNCVAVVNNIAPTASDNCPMLMVDYSINGTTNGQGNDDASGAIFSEGASMVTYTAVDMGGTSTSCTVTVTVFCDSNCTCANVPFTDMSVRWGGAPNFPIDCGQTVPVIAGLPLAVYADFHCQGSTCTGNPSVEWSLSGPAGFTGAGGYVSATPSFSFYLPQYTFYLQGNYQLDLYGYCGFDTCHCTVYFSSDGLCCKDYNAFLSLVNEGFTVNTDDCNVVLTTPQFNPCYSFPTSLDWDDGTPVITHMFPDTFVWTHTYAQSGTYTICGTVDEGGCWSSQMCTTVTVDCGSSCSGNLVQNGSFNEGIPSGYDESISLANHWDGIWPSCCGVSTGDFYNALSAPPPYIGSISTPQPISQGGFGGFWCSTNNLFYREGIMNELQSAIPFNSGNYELTFKLACLSAYSGNPVVNVYGVNTTGLATGTQPFSNSTPPNTGLFPAGTAVPLTSYTIPATCNDVYQTQTFTFNANILPTTGINYIFFTKSDQSTGDVYLAIDDVCLHPIAKICCGDSSLFVQNIEQSVTVGLDTTPCSVFLQISNLDDCDQLESVSWGDGTESVGPFSADTMLLHTYSDTGAYTLSYLASEINTVTGNPCFQRSFSQTFDSVCIVSCWCGTFNGMVFSPLPNGNSKHFNCGADIPLPCQPGVIYSVSGSFACQGIIGGCPPTAPINWTLNGPQGLVDAGTVTATPSFSIPLPSGYFSVAGTYTLLLSGTCGGSICTCYVYFVVTNPCPPLCPCDVTQMAKDVAKGFWVLQFPGSCKVCFKPKALTPCDMVSWSISPAIPNNTGNTIGKQSFCRTFPASGQYTITMIVTRKKGVNLICEVFSFTRTIQVNCGIPLPDCDKPRVHNAGFDSLAVGGVLGIDGKSANWLQVAGMPKVDTMQGSTDGWFMALAGNADGFDAIRTDEEICLEKDTGTLDIRMQSLTHFPGEQLVIQFVRGDNFLPGACEAPNCYEIAAVDVSDDSNDWVDVQVAYDLSTIDAADTCGPSSIKIRPVLYVTNDLSGDPATTRSLIYVDNFCLQGPGHSVGTHSTPLAPPIRIYPNPTTGAITVELPEAANASTRFRILDVTGRLMQETRAETGNTRQQLDASTMPAGLYFLQIVSEGKVLSMQKFVKQ